MTDTSEQTKSNTLDNNLFGINMQEVLIKEVAVEYERQIKNNPFGESPWRDINSLSSDRVGRVGEKVIQNLCASAGIISNINGQNTKEKG